MVKTRQDIPRNMFTAIIIVCLFGAVLGDIETVPLFVVDYDNAMGRETSDTIHSSDPFEKTSQNKFSQFLSQLALKSKKVIIFIENQFCTEDISGRDEHGTPYQYLRQSLLDGKVKYFPAVASAYKVLKTQFEPQPNYEIHLQSLTTSLAKNGNFKYLYAYFEHGANETRVAALRRHDLIIKQAYTMLRQMYAGPVVAIYTGMSNSIDIDNEMKMLQVVEQNLLRESSDVIVFNTNTTIFEFRGMHIMFTNGRRWQQEQPWSVDEAYNKSFIRTRLNFAGIQLEFNFQLTNTEWLLDNIKMYEEDVEVGRLRTNIRAPWGFSYSCREKLVFENERDGSVITIPRYQIEPVKEWLSRKPSALRKAGGRYFRSAISCGPYFSAPIMMSLFVVAILLAILFYGITSMMDLRTNSRLDDPHGKQLMYADVGM